MRTRSCDVLTNNELEYIRGRDWTALRMKGGLAIEREVAKWYEALDLSSDGGDLQLEVF